MKNSSLIVFCLLIAFQNFIFAQSDINNYKYVSVPDRFEFLKLSDQYQLNSLTKFLLKKNGFNLLEGSANYPKDLSENRCLLLNVDVLKLKGFLKTKLEVQFRNSFLLSIPPMQLNFFDISKPLAKPPAPQNRSIKLYFLFAILF